MRVRVSLRRSKVSLLCVRVCAAAIAALVCAAGGSVAQAQLINLSTNTTINVPIVSGTTTISVPVNVLGNVVNLNVNVTGTGSAVTLPTTNVTVTINGSPVNLSLNVAGGPIPILGGQISLPIAITLPPGLLSDVIGSTGSMISNRRNDTLLGLDLGLDRQVDLLTGSGTDATSVWSDPMALGGMRLGEVFNSGSSRDPFNSDQISFATSLQQTRQNNAAANLPSGLGAVSRRPPPAKSPFDIWAEGSFARFEDGNEASQREGHWGVLFVGADYRVSRDLLIGALASFDDAQQDLTGLASKARSTGWMVGPYATMRLTNNLFFQARAAWGKSTHELGFDGSPEDRFDADRWLVRGTLIGQWRWGPWQLRPRISVGYIEELQETYQSSLGVVVPEQKVTLGQVKGGPEVSYRYKLADGTVIEPSLLLEGVWNFTQDAGVGAIDDLAFGEDLRARIEAGVMVYLRGGLSVGAAVSYDGIGASDYQAIAGKARVRMPLN
jgi:outer membrane autotransporter protein